MIKQDLAKGLLLDVRDKEAYDIKHARHAINCPLPELLDGAFEADKGETIYLYCQLGQRSERAAAFLKEAGYEQVIDLGGLADVTALGIDLVEGDRYD